MLGEECAKVGDGEATTDCPTLYEYGESGAKQEYRNGCEVRVEMRPNNRLHHARLLDTPGWNSLHTEHDVMTAGVLKAGLADFVVLVVSKKAPPELSHHSLMHLVRECGLPCAVVMNSRDWRDELKGWSNKLEIVRNQFEKSLDSWGCVAIPISHRQGSVWACVAAWLYPGGRFKNRQECFRFETGFDEADQQRQSGVHEIRRFVFGCDPDDGVFPRILTVETLCCVLGKMIGRDA